MENEEDKKKFLMKVGIVSIMVLILIFWVLNTKNVFRGNSSSDTSIEDLKNIKNDFNSTLSQINQSLAAVDVSTSTINATSTSSVASTSLVQELIKETNKIVSSSTTTKATTTKSNCPAYINCMPTIGAARACSIPVGCEGITQIAY